MNLLPVQEVDLTDEPGRDFTSGELVLVEGRARIQSRSSAPSICRSDAVIIPVRERRIASAW